MSRIKKIIIAALIFFSAASAQKKEIVAYYGGYRSGFFIKDIERTGSAGKLTVINYAFAVPVPDSSGKIIPHINSYPAYEEICPAEKSVDGISDVSAQPLRGNFNQLKKLKKIYPDLKILLSIGGWGGSKYFSDLAQTAESREDFVNSCIDLFIEGNLPYRNSAGGKGSAKGIFDGFDLDWEFPVSGGPEGTHYSVNDRENHTALLALFREKLDAVNPDLLLTAAVSARSWEFWKYNFKKDQEYLDWFNVMTYDYHGSWESETGHHSNLLSSQKDPDPGRESFDHTIKYLLDSAGVGNYKIVPGAAFYGKGWIEVDTLNGGLYQPGKPDTTGTRIRFKNYMDFSFLVKEGYNAYWDDYALAAWMYNPFTKKFWTYDDIRSVSLKVHYADAFNLRGIMFWEITGDDTSGSLVSTIYNKNMPDFTGFILKKDNVKPLVKILEPNDSGFVTAGSHVIIRTKTSDPDGVVVKAEFFVDDHSIGYNRIAPFNWVWFNASAGIHRIKTVVTDDSGSSVSQQVQINVIKK